MRSSAWSGPALTSVRGALSLLLLCAGGSRLAAGGWEPIGPSGGDQFLVQMAPDNPDTLYSLSHSSIHVSTNRAVSWRAIHDATMNDGTFLAIAFPDHDTTHILVSRTGGGLSQTFNGGQTWEYLTNGLPAASTSSSDRVTISSMVTLPDGTVVAGVRSKTLPPAWVYSLAPGGTNWIAQGAGISITVPEALLSNVPATFLSFDANSNLWAALYGGGVFRWNTNQWEARSAGLPVEALRSTFLAHDITKSGAALLGTEDQWIYSTTNAGASWVRLSLPPPLQALEDAGAPLPFVYMIAIDPANPSVIVVRANTALTSYEVPLFTARQDQTAGDGTYATLDGGANWFPQSRYTLRMAFDPGVTESGGDPPLKGVTRSKYSYFTSVGSDSFYRSTNGGSSFAASDDGIYTYYCNALWWSATNSMLLVGGEEGITRQQRGSNSWERVDNVAGYNLYVWSFAADQQNPSNTLYSIGYPSWGFTNEMGIYRMPRDAFNGAGWTPASNQILAGTGVWRVVTTPARPAIIYAACQEHGVLVSDNGGATWSNRNAGISLPCSVTDLEVDSGGVARYASFRASSGNALAKPSQPWWPVPGESGGVYRLNAAAYIWEMMPGLTNAVLDLEASVADGITNLYAACASGIYVCSNDWSWEPLLVLPGYSAYDFLVHPARTGYLYAATTAGIRRSTDGGKQWHNFSEGLTLDIVQHLTMDRDTDTLYAGTLGNSVFRYLAPTNPFPAMALGRTNIAFGSVPVGTNAAANLIVTNSGEANLVITNMAATGSFTVSAPSGLPVTVTPLGWVTFEVRFTPAMEGAATGEITLSSNATNSPVHVHAEGTGVVPDAVFQPAGLSFGPVPAGYTKTSAIVVTNTGQAPLLVTNLVVKNSTFTLVGAPVLPAVVPPGDSRSLSIRFAPTNTLAQTGTLTVASNDPDSPASLPLSGQGYTNRGTVTVLVTPDQAIWSADTPWGDTFTRTGDVSNIPLPTGTYEIRWLDLADYALPTNSPAQVLISTGKNSTVIGNYILLTLDSDGDFMPDWQEYVAGTDPSNRLSVFAITKISAPTNSSGGFVLRWTSVSNHLYAVWQATNLVHGFALQTNNIEATAPTNVYTAAPGPSPAFYQIRVEKAP